VIGVRSSWEARRTKRAWDAPRRRSTSASRATSATMCWRRWTCHTMTTKSAVISGTSVTSSQRISPIAAWWIRTYPVQIATIASTATMGSSRQVVSP
jgi:hypothetical protein